MSKQHTEHEETRIQRENLMAQNKGTSERPQMHWGNSLTSLRILPDISIALRMTACSGLLENSRSKGKPVSVTESISVL